MALNSSERTTSMGRMAAESAVEPESTGFGRWMALIAALLGWMFDGAEIVRLLHFQRGEVAQQTCADKPVRLRLGGETLAPVLQTEFPDIAGAGGILPLFVVDGTEFKKDFAIAGVGAQSLAEELLGLVHLLQRGTQPVGGDDVGFHPLGIEFCGEAQPGEDFAFRARR